MLLSELSPNLDIPKVQQYSRVLWVGIGCQSGTSRDVIESAIRQVCGNYDLAENTIAGIATIDTKADEVGLIELCQGRNWQLKTFSAEVLNSIQVPNPSKIVAQSIGVPSVAEAAAICATINSISQKIGNSLGRGGFAKNHRHSPKSSKTRPADYSINLKNLYNLESFTPDKYKQILNHHLHSSAFICGSTNLLLVPKQIFRSDPPTLQARGGAVTVAIALAETE